MPDRRITFATPFWSFWTCLYLCSSYSVRKPHQKESSCPAASVCPHVSEQISQMSHILLSVCPPPFHAMKKSNNANSGSERAYCKYYFSSSLVLELLYGPSAVYFLNLCWSLKCFPCSVPPSYWVGDILRGECCVGKCRPSTMQTHAAGTRHDPDVWDRRFSLCCTF